MRVLLVTNSDKLEEKLNVLNLDLEYRGIVVDKIDSAKEILLMSTYQSFSVRLCHLHGK